MQDDRSTDPADGLQPPATGRAAVSKRLLKPLVGGSLLISIVGLAIVIIIALVFFLI